MFVKKRPNPLRERRPIVLRGHPGKSAAHHLFLQQHAKNYAETQLKLAQHAYDSHLRTKKCPRRRRLQIRPAVAAAILVAMARETAAAFAPNTRSELQNATFGCVGACGQALSTSGEWYSYCNALTGPWVSGTGYPCDNGVDGVPNGQGTGKYGEISYWNVAKVEDMSFSESLVVACVFWYSRMQ